MSNSTHDDSNRSRLTRRRLLAATAGASATGLAALAVGTEQTRGQVSVDGISIADGTYEAVDPDPTPLVTVSGEWSYTVGQTPTDVAVACTIAPPDGDPLEIGRDSFDTGQSSVGTDFSFEGPLTDHPDFDADEFAPDREETTSRDVVVTVRLVVNADDEVLVEAETSDTATVTVTNTGSAIDVSISGSGEIAFSNDG